MEKQFARLNSTLQELLINLREMNEKRSSQLNYIRDESVRENDLVKYISLYLDLMKFWNKKIPNFIYNLDYQKLIGNQKEEIQKHIRDREILLNTFFEDDCFELFN